MKYYGLLEGMEILRGLEWRKNWFLVNGPGVNWVKIPAKDADHAVEIAAAISKTPTKDLRVWCATLDGKTECWHFGQL